MKMTSLARGSLRKKERPKIVTRSSVPGGPGSLSVPVAATAVPPNPSTIESSRTRLSAWLGSRSGPVMLKAIWRRKAALMVAPAPLTSSTVTLGNRVPGAPSSCRASGNQGRVEET